MTAACQPSPQPPSMLSPQALAGIRICDFTGQLAGAGATKWLAAFGAEVIRIEDPVRKGAWDILRGMPPYPKGKSGGLEMGGAFNNHNIGKLGITLNMKSARGREMLAEIVRQSDVVTENFAAGVLARWGFDHEALKAIRPDIIYVSNCGFGHSGPYRDYKSWGPIVQAVSGLTFSTGLPGQPPAGWGYSYMDHTGAYYMAIAILLAIIHRKRIGEGQWIDLACAETALTLSGPALLDWTVNGRSARRDGQPHSNRSASPPMAPHGIYPCAGDDEWVAIACRDEVDWARLTALAEGPIGAEWAGQGLPARLHGEDALDGVIADWTKARGKFEVQAMLRAAGIPCSAVQRPHERVDHDPDTEGLWPTVTHSAMGEVQVEGFPARFSATPWRVERGAACLGEHNEDVFGRLLGLSPAEVAALADEGVI